MNAERDNDALDQALRSRAAMAPSTGFTGQVLARVGTDRPRSTTDELFAAYGVRYGIGAAALGVLLSVDIFSVASTLSAALAAPYVPVVAGIVVICLIWALMQYEPEGEAL